MKACDNLYVCCVLARKKFRAFLQWIKFFAKLFPGFVVIVSRGSCMNKLAKGFRDREVSHGTLKSEDLIPAFMEFMESVIPVLGAEFKEKVDKLKAEVNQLNIQYVESGSKYSEPGEASYVLHEMLFPALDEIAPEGCYFGASDGDGSAFGFWGVEDDGTF